jgi:hypothetical protein
MAAWEPPWSLRECEKGFGDSTPEKKEMSMSLESWNDTPTKQAILDFVAAASADGGSGYIPPAERIAAFDNDGTLWVEQPAPAQPFDAESLAPEVRKAVAEGVAAAHDRIKAESLRVGRQVNNWTLIGEGFGYRSMVGGKDLLRAAANMVGIYGNNPEEAYNFSGVLDADGEPLDASKHNYVIKFDTPPPVKAFWSITMYKLPVPLFIANPINRYSIGDRTPGFRPDPDGSVTIYLQHQSPGADKEANWLPAPDGPFALALRIYWPEQDVLDGSWEPSAIQKT